MYAEHANRKELQTEDVKLAIQANANHSFASPPPREVRRKTRRNRWFVGFLFLFLVLFVCSS